MPEDFDLRHFLATLRRQALLVSVVAVAFALTAFLASAAQDKKYRATETLLYTPSLSSFTPTTTDEQTRAINTLVSLAKTDRVLDDAGRALGLQNGRLLKDRVSVSGNANDDLLRIAATAHDPRDAARFAGAVSASLVDWRKTTQQDLITGRIASLQDQLNELAGRATPSAIAAAGDLRTQLAEAQAELSNTSGDLTVVAPAKPPASAYAPHPFRNLVIGLLAGLLLGAGLGFMRDRLDRRIRSLEQIEHAYAVPMLGVVPYVRAAARGQRSRGTANFDSASVLADAFRMIRTNLQLVSPNGVGGGRVIVVSSAVPGEGKSAVAANLAAALAASGRRVLALSADLRSPALHEYFSLRHEEGLIQVLAGDVPLTEAVRTISRNGAGPEQPGGELALLGSAQRVFDPAILFQSDAMTRLFAEVKQKYEFVIVDSPPLLASADASLLAKQGDAVVLVARVGALTTQDAARARKALHVAAVTPIGVVAVGEPDPGETYGYGYGYGHDGSADDDS
jgi:tyrosine-protein kinase